MQSGLHNSMAYTGAIVPAVIAIYLKSNYVETCCVLAAIAITIQEHITTVADEVEFVWGRRISSSVLLFHLNRWLILLWAFATLLAFPSVSTVPVCIAQNLSPQGISIMLYLVWAAFSALRVYGVSNGSRFFALVVCTLNVIPAALNIYCSMISYSYDIVNLPVIGTTCIISGTVPKATMTKYTIASRTCIIASDVIVIVMTWRATRRLVQDATRIGIKMPIPTMLLKDGSIYFALLLTLNIIQVAGFATDTFLYAVGIFGTPLSSIIVSRFLLGIRCAASKQSGEVSLSDVQGSSTLSDMFKDMAGDLYTGVPACHLAADIETDELIHGCGIISGSGPEVLCDHTDACGHSLHSIVDVIRVGDSEPTGKTCAC
ncbi:hypothetical protein OBBRIDRAFT_826730 [Obba rivulosa]|uniref:DUF6533 domain-containing protein n=1 Tax=Obba rivulosa TaxID=1052685 RepID=A0A8E2AQK6_9APHY|nr:hypothetical protein OBBRIDRAFT_826730 [Obba rivulosa]